MRRAGGLRWHVREPLLTRAAESILDDPNRFLAEHARILKSGRRSTLGALDGFVLKRYTRRDLKAVKDIFRPSRARNDFLHACRLEVAGIRTPRAVAVAEDRISAKLSRSYFLMQEIAPASDLNRQTLTPELLRAAAELIARLHSAGFSHGDLKNNNILVDAAGCLNLIDLEQVRYHGKISDARAARDLDRFFEHAGAFGGFLRERREAFLSCYWFWRHQCSKPSRFSRFKQSAGTYFSVLIRSPFVILLESIVG